MVAKNSIEERDLNSFIESETTSLYNSKNYFMDIMERKHTESDKVTEEDSFKILRKSKTAKTNLLSYPRNLSSEEVKPISIQLIMSSNAAGLKSSIMVGT